MNNVEKLKCTLDEILNQRPLDIHQMRETAREFHHKFLRPYDLPNLLLDLHRCEDLDEAKQLGEEIVECLEHLLKDV